MNRPTTLTVVVVVACGVLAPVVLPSGAVAQSNVTATPSPTDTDTETSTPSPADTETSTPNPTDTATPSPTSSSTPTSSPTETAGATPTSGPTATDTEPPSPTPTATESVPATETATETPDSTATANSGESPNGPSASGTDGSDGVIDECTDVTEPGRHELAGDVGHEVAETCIDIRADDVVLDGNGHAITGPGPSASAEDAIYRGVYVNWSDNVTLRNVVVEGWSPGVRAQNAGTAGENLTLVEVTVRNSDDGIVLEETGNTDLQGVTAEDNDGFGIGTDRIGAIHGDDVTLRNNERGLGTWDSHGIHLENSRIVDNDENGINLHHHSSLTLRDVTVSGNGEDGIDAISSGGFHVSMTMTDGTVEDNGRDGVSARGNADLALTGTTVAENGRFGIVASGGSVTATDVTVRDNADVEVNSFDGVSGPGGPEGDVIGDGLAIGPAATTTFENESIGLEPVERSSLSSLPGDASAVGDGLNLSGPVDGPVELELDADADGEDVALWRHDGSEWETAAEDPAVDGETLRASVERNGTYAPVSTDDTSGTPTGTTTVTETPTGTSTETPTGTSTETPTGTSTETPEGTSTTTSTVTETPTDRESRGTDAGTTAEPGDGDEGTATDDGETGGGVVTIGDGSGFVSLTAVLALLGGALLVRRWE